MNRQKIEDSIEEAHKFIERANTVLRDIIGKKDDVLSYGGGNKNSGALRRQSLELTNSLANLRKPN